MAINPVTGGQAVNVSTGINGRRAQGGAMRAGESYLVGEQGPEVVTVGAPGWVTPTGGGGSPIVINANITAASDPRAGYESLLRALRTYGAADLKRALGLS